MAVSLYTDDNICKKHEYITIDKKRNEVICLACGMLESKSNLTELELKEAEDRDIRYEKEGEIPMMQFYQRKKWLEEGK